ncbi:FRG domain-containing protein [Flavobacterium sp. 14A]|uniref:FRG domain-containing protein n=1 Tax=Flavobacterium sp. 14A TaxID=2735896 RepID=UPI00156EEC5A|nr:FRG domain-containing protein [Flavobacterium sp. 14A]NRT10583.1 hypothetical protein [Flavobacterium sp. 14A]
MQTIEQLIAKYQGTRIKSIAELKPIISQIQELRIYYDIMENYRGHGLVKYELNCGLARNKLSPEEFIEIEKKLYNDFMNFVANQDDYIRLPFGENDNNPELKNKWYALYQAQHLGLKTRFMDWSIGWETALMFAVENEKHFGQDGTFNVFLVPRDQLFNSDKISKASSQLDPFELEKDMMINTPIYLLNDKFDYVGEKRISRQAGRFWLQSVRKGAIDLKEQPEYKDLLLELIIEGDAKKSIKAELEAHGATIDWQYYRKDDNVDEELKAINVKNLGE